MVSCVHAPACRIVKLTVILPAIPSICGVLRVDFSITNHDASYLIAIPTIVLANITFSHLQLQQPKKAQLASAS